MTLSPGNAWRLSRRSARRTTPSMVAETTGRLTTSLTSVWPPARTMFSAAAVAEISLSSAIACDGVVPVGNRTVVSRLMSRPVRSVTSVAC